MVIKRPQKKSLLLSRLLGAIAVAVLLIGAVISLGQFVSNKAADAHIAHETQLANNGQPSSAPSTVKPDESEFNNYKVAADSPRYIFIPKLSVKAIVKPVGLTTENQIQAPTNVYHAGWFTGGAKPGQSGATVIDGHVSNWEALSIFHELKKLAPGDQVSIERGDGQTITYAVIKSQSYPADNVDMAAALAPINPDKPGLNLITCDGKVIKGNEYEKRLVVFAQQL